MSFNKVINAKQEKQFDKELTFVRELLKAHDKFFEMSDDHSIYRRGQLQKDNIIKILVERVGLSARQAYQYYNDALYK